MRMKNLNALLLTAALFTLGTTLNAQERVSPLKEAKTIISGSVNLAITYSSPSVKGRKIWGDLVPFGEVWRTGANEATTFEVNKDVLVNGQRLAAGKYAFFTIPSEKTWTLVFNKEPNQWGAYNYKEAMDALRVTAKPKAAKAFSEQLMITADSKGKVVLTWENLSVPFKVKAL